VDDTGVGDGVLPAGPSLHLQGYNLVLLDAISCGRFFKSIVCKHDDGIVIVKFYLKPPESPSTSRYALSIWGSGRE
jgi:hypothetical protein